MTQETFEQMVERIASEMPDCKLDDVSAFGHLYYFEPPELVEFATRLRDELTRQGYVLADLKGQEPVECKECRGTGKRAEGATCWGCDGTGRSSPFVAAPAKSLATERQADAVAKDAERYQWLKENCALGIKQNGIGWSLNTRQCVAPDCMKELDAAIDAAICSKEHELLTKREGKESGK